MDEFVSFEITEFNLVGQIILDQELGLLKILRGDDGRLVLIAYNNYYSIDQENPTPAKIANLELIPGGKQILQGNHLIINIFINFHNYMEDFDIPIFKKIYDLYKQFYILRKSVAKQDRYTLWQRCENVLLDILESILLASQLSKTDKLPVLQKASLKLNFLRIFLRLMKETKSLAANKYVTLQQDVDEVGRMLGGWIKSTKEL
jgi:hypothetical protein